MDSQFTEFSCKVYCKEIEYELTIRLQNNKLIMLANEKSSFNSYILNETYDEIEDSLGEAQTVLTSLKDLYLFTIDEIEDNKAEFQTFNDYVEISLIYEIGTKRIKKSFTIKLRLEKIEEQISVDKIEHYVKSYVTEHLGNESKLQRVILDMKNDIKSVKNNVLEENFVNSLIDEKLENYIMGERMTSIVRVVEKMKFAFEDMNTRLIDRIDNLENRFNDISSKLAIPSAEKVIKESSLSNEEFELIKKWIGKEIYLKIIYKATKHGFSSADFHNKCDNIGPTVSIITSHLGKRFGGFTHCNWNQIGDYQNDNSGKGFIFSLSNSEKYKIIHNTNGIFCHSNYILTYGAGHDIFISTNSDTLKGSYTNFPHSYNNDSNSLSATEETNALLAGSYYFQTVEIEVFHVEV